MSAPRTPPRGARPAWPGARCVAAGAGFVVRVCGDIMTMPGLPREPAALRIDFDDDGRVRGHF